MPDYLTNLPDRTPLRIRSATLPPVVQARTVAGLAAEFLAARPGLLRDPSDAAACICAAADLSPDADPTQLVIFDQQRGAFVIVVDFAGESWCAKVAPANVVAALVGGVWRPVAADGTLATGGSGPEAA